MSTHPAFATDRAVRRASAVVAGSFKLEPAAAELILFTLARQLDRPVSSVANDLLSGNAFAGRPSWL
jgi:hypothetical protein